MPNLPACPAATLVDAGLLIGPDRMLPLFGEPGSTVRELRVAGEDDPAEAGVWLPRHGFPGWAERKPVWLPDSTTVLSLQRWADRHGWLPCVYATEPGGVEGRLVWPSVRQLAGLDDWFTLVARRRTSQVATTRCGVTVRDIHRYVRVGAR